MTPAYTALLDLIRSRRSATTFSDALVTDDELVALVEAARHAPSSYNEQPWRLVIARRGEAAYDALHGALRGRNPEWAATAPVLGLSLASSAFARNGKPNRHAWHDTGAFMMAFSLAATALGLSVHQMAGVDGSAAAEALGVPDGMEPVAAFALGHPVDTPAEKGRRSIGETARGPVWGETRV